MRESAFLYGDMVAKKAKTVYTKNTLKHFARYQMIIVLHLVEKEGSG